MTKVPLATEVTVPVDRNRYDWASVARAAKEARGQWVRVEQPMNRGYVNQICKGRIKVFQPAGDFDARTTIVDQQGEPILYVRYLGEDDD